MMRAGTRIVWLVFGLIYVAGCASNGTGPQGPKSIASTSEQPYADERNLIHEVRIDQDDINAGSVAFEDLFYAGKHIFSNRFTSEDNYGEGPTGPRRSRYEIADRKGLPFLRFNGLDSQSCLECHLAAGFAAQENYPKPPNGVRFAKQLGFTAGGAGFASSAFGFANFDGSTPGEPTTRGFVRSPPHAFGAGYTQTLAEEMSWDLMDQLQAALAAPTGQPVPLQSKGVSFGSVVVSQNGTVDYTGLEGVSEDLVVRPFQWKGIASNLRNFIRDAMNFHFSVQPREFLVLHPQSDDKDAELNEILEGEISAVATFLAFLRPPTESASGLNSQEVKRGRMVFEQVGCASCHTPSLVLDHSVATIRDPRNDLELMTSARSQAPMLATAATEMLTAEPSADSSAFITVPSAVSPTLEKYLARNADTESNLQPQPLSGGRSAMMGNISGYARDLGLKNGPPESLPRLATQGKKTAVPLYSDLKRHKMGTNLEEPFPQTTDGGQEIPGDQFLTRPLWGVADTGPWLHDGRALTLTEAILLHDGPGSEANATIASFKGLPAADQQAVRAFLSSLRLPTVP